MVRYLKNRNGLNLKKIISVAEAARLIKNNSSVMIGGFLSCGVPYRTIDEMIKLDLHGLTLIANDTGVEGFDKSRLIAAKAVKKAIVTHIGTNPETGRQWQNGEIDVELVPMGTLIERIRAAGSGLGGILTPTGVGTIVEDGKTVIESNGRRYLLETPLEADFAVVYATKIDRYGNAFLSGTTRNFNPVMATAASTVIVEADELSESPLDPDQITIPGVFVDYIAL
jgi:acetate CoA/acetoacetate CoA-transferase alpha subunit